MGTVARQEKIGDSSIILSFESYQDFLDYQQKERAQDALDLAEAANKRLTAVSEFFDAFSNPKSGHRLDLSKGEFYYLSCILGHLVPAGKISKSLLDKVSLDDLDCEDFDLIQFKGDEIGGYSITINEENV
nr:MAG TPA: hypothetical protein [Caudoviricetes sp.]